MAKKKAEELIIELKEIYVDREVNYLNKLLNEEEADDEEEKFLRKLKTRLNFVEKLNNQLLGKTGKEKKVGDTELWAKLIDMKSSVGKIVQSIPKTGSTE